jgi:hypothetical protein
LIEGSRNPEISERIRLVICLSPRRRHAPAGKASALWVS